jgi:hypothetical protein
MSNPTICHLYEIAVAADDAWQDALVAAYGREMACDARYDRRGNATPELLALHQAKLMADDALREAFRMAVSDASRED